MMFIVIPTLFFFASNNKKLFKYFQTPLFKEEAECAASTSISVHTEFFLLSLNSNFTFINPKSILGTDRPDLTFHRSKNWGSENFILTSPNHANNLQDSLELTSRAHGSSSVGLTVYVFCVDIFSKGILFGN